ncbi:pyridoxal-phosphate dependent enzyme [Halomonas dongshanensis]|uniref:cysteine synthase n=1 Tax=Halomonas dongshanensis TaxID=2890835 RepID=A0ABT2EGF8_9GAMM|nr:pyridoxal-phosphate dependent enzyme [Halomonas dongshanensis]MCS2610673.1 pyridoxal-phosphate dependent enzyme [Halomonas dongshanensis]
MIRYESVLDEMRNATLFMLGKNLHMVSFKAMKIIPANYIIKKALYRGDLKPGGLVVETSSGNFALGMAIVCNSMNLRFIAIGDPAIDESYKRQLEMLGGRVEIITDKNGSEGYQKARLERLHEILNSQPDAFWCRQYDNEDNANAYSNIGHQLKELIGPQAFLVAPVGSGGSSCGIASSMRSTGADCTLIGVDTFNSVLFGQGGGPVRLRGLGNTVMPKNLRHQLFDDVHWLTPELANHNTRLLYSSTGHFRGPTTGAAYTVARFVHDQNPGIPIVFLSPDDGSRYTNTTYLKESNTAGFEHLAPHRLQWPTEYDEHTHWAWMNWNRQPIQAYH